MIGGENTNPDSQGDQSKSLLRTGVTDMSAEDAQRRLRDPSPPGEAGHRTTQGSRDRMVQGFLNITRGMPGLVFTKEELTKIREEARRDYDAQFLPPTEADKTQS